MWFSHVGKQMLSLVGLVVLASGLSAGDSTLTRILNAWTKRRDIAPALEYELAGNVTYIKGCFTELNKAIGLLPPDFAGDVPEHEHISPKNCRLALDLRENWIRKEISEDSFCATGPPKGGFFVPSFQIFLYDGKDFQLLEPREKNSGPTYKPSRDQPDVKIPTKKVEDLTFSDFDLPVLMAHGVMPAPTNWISAKRLLRPLDTMKLSGHGKGFVDDAECVVLRSAAGRQGFYFEFWVDLSKDSAVRRFRKVASERATCQVDIKYVPTSGTWLPNEWLVMYYSKGKQASLTREEHVKVTKTNTTPLFEDNYFRFTPTPGMIVRNAEQRKTYRVDNAGRLVQVAGRTSPSVGGGTMWIWAVLLALLGVGCSVYIRRVKVRSAHKRTES